MDATRVSVEAVAGLLWRRWFRHGFRSRWGRDLLDEDDRFFELDVLLIHRYWRFRGDVGRLVDGRRAHGLFVVATPAPARGVRGCFLVILRLFRFRVEVEEREATARDDQKKNGGEGCRFEHGSSPNVGDLTNRCFQLL